MSDSQYLLKNCEVCGKAFSTSRRHAKCCSDKCRKKLSRQGRAKKQPENVTQVTLSYLDYLVGKHLTMPVAEDWQNA